MNICIILRRPPYGTVDASEAIRHTLGGITEDVSVRLLLMDGGILSAKKGHDNSMTPFSSIEEGIKDCIDMGVDVYLDKASLKEEYTEPEEIIEGVKIINGHEIAEIIKTSDLTMIF